MFTGIIREIGRLSKTEKKNNRAYFSIECTDIQKNIQLGDSVCCNGICLTVVESNRKFIKAEVMQETLKKTNASSWKKNELINLENSLSLSSRLDGHLVYGHVDTTAQVISISKLKETFYITLKFNLDFLHLIVPQGSIAINGVSLTIASVEKSTVKVAIIGHTLELTNLGYLKTGSLVNVEFDIIGKYVFNYMKKFYQAKSDLLD